jgi:inner membrane protein involved in colicin E2 resistance
MKEKRSDEFESFDKVMGGLLSVPYSELQKKLEEEKQEKQKRKRATSSAPASRASSSRKKRVA